MGGVLYRRGGLTEEGRGGGSTGQGTHTGEESERRRKHLRMLNMLFKIELFIENRT